jgi:hypothetical protein
MGDSEGREMPFEPIYYADRLEIFNPIGHMASLHSGRHCALGDCLHNCFQELDGFDTERLRRQVSFMPTGNSVVTTP